MRTFTLTMLLLATLSCGDKHISEKQRDIVKEEMSNRKLKKLADVDIMNAAKQQAAQLADTAQKLLGSTLMKTIQEKGVVEAISFCNVVAYPLVDSVAKASGADIRRVSLRLRNPADAPNDYEREILEAYQYAVQSGVTPQEEIQFSEDKKYVLYSKPIAINNGMCLNCHGTVGKEISAPVHEKIVELYPEDDATGHAMGDLRGIWSVKIPVQEVVKKM